jgi:hypothetical protein
MPSLSFLTKNIKIFGTLFELLAIVVEYDYKVQIGTYL